MFAHRPADQIEAALAHRAVTLVIGGDLPPQITGRPTRRDLAAALAAKHPTIDTPALTAASDQARAPGLDPHTVIAELLARIGDNITDFQGALAHFVRAHNITNVITTVYASTLSRALADAQLPHTVAWRDDQLPPPDAPALLKPLGDVLEPQSLILAGRDLENVLCDPHKVRLLARLHTALRDHTVLFIGYDPAAPDFDALWRALFAPAEGFPHGAYALWPTPTKDLSAAWHALGVELLTEDPFDLIAPSGLEMTMGTRTAHPKGASAPFETLRLDAAVPEQVVLGRTFDLAVAVRRPESPLLQEEDMTRVESGSVQVTWPEDAAFINMRVAVSAPDCEIHGEASQAFRLYQEADSPVLYFQLTPQQPGKLSIVVKVYQEDFALGSARVRTVARNSVAGQVRTSVVSYTLERPEVDLQLRINRYNADLDGYPVEAQISDGSYFGGGLLRLDDAALASAPDALAYGQQLWDALFTGPIREAYTAAVIQAQASTGGRLRVRLWIGDDAGELHAVAWERIIDGLQASSPPLAAAGDRYFSRYIGLGRREPPPVAARPLRILVAIANPDDLADYNLAPLNVEREINVLLDALDALPPESRPHLTLLPGRTGLPASLRSELESAADIRLIDGPTTLTELITALHYGAGGHVLHFLGHGRFDPANHKAVLFLEDEQGHTRPVAERTFVTRMDGIHPLPRLIVLAACESAAHPPGEPNPFVGLAPQLIEIGVPAVVAMQDRVPISIARAFTGAFYGYLFDHGVVDRAMNQARLRLLDNWPRDWATPVLFLRLKTGRLFLKEPASQPAPSVPTRVMRDA